MSYEDDPKFRQWAEHVRDDVIPKIAESNVFVTIAPAPDKVDVKFAVELGLCIMYDKPILSVLKPGEKMSEHLRRVSDLVVEADITTVTGREALSEAIIEFEKKYG